MSVTEINGLLYLPGHPREKLERCASASPRLRRLAEPFSQALLQQKVSRNAVTGNPD
mgnify:CR=1 FL=1